MSYGSLERGLLAALAIALAVPLSHVAARSQQHVSGTEIDLLQIDDHQRAESFSPRDPRATAFAWRTLRRLWWSGSTATIVLMPIAAGVAIATGELGDYVRFQKALFGGVFDAAFDFIGMVQELPRIAKATADDPWLLSSVAYAALDGGLTSALDAIAIFFLHDDDAEAAHVAGAFVLMRWTSKAGNAANSKLMPAKRFARAGHAAKGLGIQHVFAVRRAVFSVADETMSALHNVDRFVRRDLPSFTRQSISSIRSAPRAIGDGVTNSVPVKFGRTFFDRTATAAEVAAGARELGAVTRAYAAGVVQGPFHILGDIAQPKVFVPIAVTTAALGVAFHYVGIDAAIIATPVLLGVTAARWTQVIQLVRRSTGADRYKMVGLETVLTIENGSELLGVHLLPHGDEHPSSDPHADEEENDVGNPLWTHFGRPALQGILGFHDFFFTHVGHGDHLPDKDQGVRNDGPGKPNVRPQRHR